MLKPGTKCAQHRACVTGFRIERIDVVTFDDLRGRSRSLRVTERRGDGVWADAEETAYLGPETLLAVGGARRRGGRRFPPPMT